MVLDHNFGDGSRVREDVIWPGNAPSVISWITQLEREWIAAVGGLDDRSLSTPDHARWPFTGGPFGRRRRLGYRGADEERCRARANQVPLCRPKGLTSNVRLPEMRLSDATPL